jgi:hypothetical protein
MSRRDKREQLARQATTAELIRSLELYDSVLPIERNVMVRASLQTRREIVLQELRNRGVSYVG